MVKRWLWAVVGAALTIAPAASAQSQPTHQLRLVKPLKLSLPKVAAALTRPMGVPVVRPLANADTGLELAPGLRFKRKNWMFESLKRLDVSLGDPLFGMRFALNTAKREAVLKLRSRALARAGFGLNTDVTFRGKRAIIDAAIALKLAGQRYDFELPQVELVPRNFRGTQYIEYRLPLLQGDF